VNEEFVDVNHRALLDTAMTQVTSALGDDALSTLRPMSLRDAETLAGRIDHTALAANVTAEDIDRLCAEAEEFSFASVCVNGRWVSRAASRLEGTDVLICSVVGFPLGAMSHSAKAEEARIAVAQGATEIDMVMDVGGLKSGDLVGVAADMAGVAQAAGGYPVKVILETCLLSQEEVILSCLLALRTNVAYVKTSTGFGASGATIDDVALMREIVGNELGVKASGGIRTRAVAEAMVSAGADRIGASASVAIISEP
jgi:deoxyribose-phosphate aldolase